MLEGRRTKRPFSRKTPGSPCSLQSQEDGRKSKDEKQKPYLTLFPPSVEILLNFQFMIYKSLSIKETLI